MADKDRVLALIYEAAEELNEDLPEEQQLDSAPETILFGKDASLDSIGLVNLIAAVEERIEDELDAALTLADERAMSQKRSPFRSIDSLADYICTLLEEA